MSAGANKMDLINQYITGVLIPRVNQADSTVSAYESMKLHLRLITVLDDDGGLRDKWGPKVEALDRVAQTITGIDSTTTYSKRDRARNYLAERLLPSMRADVWAKLHELGYFKMDGESFHDPSRGRPSPR